MAWSRSSHTILAGAAIAANKDTRGEMSEINEGKGMSTAKPRKTTRTTSRNRKNADATPTTTGDGVAADQPAPIPSIEDAPLSPSSSAASSSGDDREEIRRRAYELYVSRGGSDGDDLSDWLEAERLVRNSRRSETNAGRGEVRPESPSA